MQEMVQGFAGFEKASEGARDTGRDLRLTVLVLCLGCLVLFLYGMYYSLLARGLDNKVGYMEAHFTCVQNGYVQMVGYNRSFVLCGYGFIGSGVDVLNVSYSRQFVYTYPLVYVVNVSNVSDNRNVVIRNT